MYLTSTPLDVPGDPSPRLDASERRRQPRFSPPRCAAMTGDGPLTLVDLSRSGMGVTVESARPLIPGGGLRVRLDDGRHEVEVMGQLRWSAHDRVLADRVRRELVVQRAGVAVLEVLTPNPQGIWRGLTPVPASASEPGPPRSGQAGVASPDPRARPFVTLIDPANGAVVHSPFVTIRGAIEHPHLVSRITLNGVDASLEGEEFSIALRLRPEVNYLFATVHEWRGAYRSCYLGTLRSGELGQV